MQRESLLSIVLPFMILPLCLVFYFLGVEAQKETAACDRKPPTHLSISVLCDGVLKIGADFDGGGEPLLQQNKQKITAAKREQFDCMGISISYAMDR